MTTVAEMTQWFRKAFTETQSQMLAEATVRLHEDLVRREDFTTLTKTVERLAERTDRIAVAQQQTTQELRELATMQKETGHELKALAVIQKELSESTKVVQGQIGELTSTSKATQEQIATLAWAMKNTQKQLGGLTQSVGYGLEAYAMDRIPKILTKQLRFLEESSGPEQCIAVSGSQDDIDVVVRGTLDGRPIVFLCEAKTKISSQEVHDFLATADRVRPKIGCDNVRIFYFAYRASPEARAAVRDVGCYLAFPHTILVEPLD